MLADGKRTRQSRGVLCLNSLRDHYSIVCCPSLYLRRRVLLVAVPGGSRNMSKARASRLQGTRRERRHPKILCDPKSQICHQRTFRLAEVTQRRKRQQSGGEGRPGCFVCTTLQPFCVTAHAQRWRHPIWPSYMCAMTFSPPLEAQATGQTSPLPGI